MIIDYDHNPNLNTDQKLQSLMMSIQMALNSGEIFTGNKAALDFYHPVGSYFETSDISFNPNKAWGGTWVLEEEGLVHIGAGENYAIGVQGGEEEVTLTDAEMAHGHGNTIKARYPGSGATRGAVFAALDSALSSNQGTITNSSSASYNYLRIAHSGAGVHRYQPWMEAVDCTMSGSVSDLSGASSTRMAHNNMQPYVVVNRWHRTA